MRFCLTFLFFFTSFFAELCSAVDVPRGLDGPARLDVTKILGATTAHKMLTNPYPLGGYSGFEFGLSMDVISTRDLQRVGTSSNSDQDELRYSRLTFGKGLYNDVDVFLEFVPPIANVGLTDYGAAVRWAFYQAEFLPIHASIWGYGNQINYKNSFSNQNLGTDLVVGLNVDNFAIYVGMGIIYSKGSFIGGTTGSSTVPTTDPQLNGDTNMARTDTRVMHSVVGCTVSFYNLFFAGEIDRYTDPVYSAKIGLRY